MYLTGSGSSITANRISGTLSTSRHHLAATTINYNGVDYAVFGGGGYSSSEYKDTVDFINLGVDATTTII